MAYKTPAALEMAVKAAAQASSVDTGRAIQDFYYHRLLCRVFADGNERFVLKGGHSLLARTTGARLTRDIDLLSLNTELDDALGELLRLSKLDLGDFVSFDFIKAEPIKVEDKYRSGVKVLFTPRIGMKHLQVMSIDLVVDEAVNWRPERITPADRIEVRGIETCDYFVYPAEVALADKYFGIIEKHSGRISSRVKDLVDVLVYGLTMAIDGDVLAEQMAKEGSIRHIQIPRSFEMPEDWQKLYTGHYQKLCKGTVIPTSLQTLEAGASFAARLLDPALDGSCAGLTWDPARLEWSPGYVIRPIRDEEVPLLWDFLYGAIFVPEDHEGEIPRSVIYDDPLCRAAVEGFGERPDDRAVVAEVDGEVVGACWVRTTNEYGHIDAETPSFSISVHEPYRGWGIGSAMMRAVLGNLANAGYERASLSVQKENPALRLYERLGFRIVGDGADETEWLMVCDL